MDRNHRVCARALRASTLLLLLAATAAAQLTRGERDDRELRRIYPIDLKVGESRLVDRALVQRIRCRDGVLVVQPFGRSAVVQCMPRL